MKIIKSKIKEVLFKKFVIVNKNGRITDQSSLQHYTGKMRKGKWEDFNLYQIKKKLERENNS